MKKHCLLPPSIGRYRSFQHMREICFIPKHSFFTVRWHRKAEKPKCLKRNRPGARHFILCHRLQDFMSFQKRMFEKNCPAHILFFLKKIQDRFFHTLHICKKTILYAKFFLSDSFPRVCSGAPCCYGRPVVPVAFTADPATAQTSSDTISGAARRLFPCNPSTIFQPPPDSGFPLPQFFQALAVPRHKHEVPAPAAIS